VLVTDKYPELNTYIANLDVCFISDCKWRGETSHR